MYALIIPKPLAGKKPSPLADKRYMDQSAPGAIHDKAHLFVIPAESPAEAGRRAGTHVSATS